MLPGTGYFRTMPCPFYDSGFCERPYCHFKHVRKEVSKPATETSTSQASEEPKVLEIDESKSLELMVENAVKKLLAEGKVADTAVILQAMKKTGDENATETQADSESKPKLYLPPEDCPPYNPTPIKDLEKGVASAGEIPTTSNACKDLQFDKLRAVKPKQKTAFHNLSSGLTQASLLEGKKSGAVPVKKTGKKKFSYKPPVEKEEVFGDIEDLSDSDTEKGPDVLGSILNEGNKSGVLSGGTISAFEEEVIKEKWKLLKKKTDINEDMVRDQCEKISSSVDVGEKLEDAVDCEKEVVQEETEEEKSKRQEEEKMAEEALKAKILKEEEETNKKKLEENRKVLENYYKIHSQPSEEGNVDDKNDDSQQKETNKIKEKVTMEKVNEEKIEEKELIKNKDSCSKDENTEKENLLGTSKERKADHKDSKSKSSSKDTKSNKSSKSHGKESHSSRKSESKSSKEESRKSELKSHKEESRGRSSHKDHKKEKDGSAKDKDRSSSHRHHKDKRESSSKKDEHLKEKKINDEPAEKVSKGGAASKSDMSEDGKEDSIKSSDKKESNKEVKTSKSETELESDSDEESEDSSKSTEDSEDYRRRRRSKKSRHKSSRRHHKSSRRRSKHRRSGKSKHKESSRRKSSKSRHRSSSESSDRSSSRSRHKSSKSSRHRHKKSKSSRYSKSGRHKSDRRKHRSSKKHRRRRYSSSETESSSQYDSESSSEKSDVDSKKSRNKDLDLVTIKKEPLDDDSIAVNIEIPADIKVKQEPKENKEPTVIDHIVLSDTETEEEPQSAFAKAERELKAMLSNKSDTSKAVAPNKQISNNNVKCDDKKSVKPLPTVKVKNMSELLDDKVLDKEKSKNPVLDSEALKKRALGYLGYDETLKVKAEIAEDHSGNAANVRGEYMSEDDESFNKLFIKKQKTWSDIKPWEDDFTSTAKVRKGKIEETIVKVPPPSVDQDIIATEEDEKESEEEFVPETGKSFLDAMQEIESTKSPSKRKSSEKVGKDAFDALLKSKPSSREKSKDKSHHRSNDSHKRSRRSPDKHSRDKGRESSDKHSRDKGRESSDKHSRDKERESSSRKRERDEKESKHRKDKKDKSRKSPSPKRKRLSERRSKSDAEGDTRPDSTSPLPDISEELAMLPDDIGELDFDTVDNGMEEMFDGFNDDDDDGDSELMQIFNDYQHDTSADDAALKKQKQLAAQKAARDGENEASSSSVGKKRTALHAESGTKRPLHMKKPQLKTPGQVMAARYKKLQEIRKQEKLEKQLSALTEEPQAGTSSSTTRKPSTFIEPSFKAKKIRTAHAASSAPPPILGKAQKQLASREGAKTSSKPSTSQTIAKTIPKGEARIAHTPSSRVIVRPVIVPDSNSKVPAAIRQRYLNSIINECIKISRGDEEKAFERAEREEAECVAKAASRMVYLNVVVNCIKKLRAEAALAGTTKASVMSGRNLTPSAPLDPSPVKRNMLTTHLQVLAGKGGAQGSWSIEKPIKSLTDSELDEDLLYGVMTRNYQLTEEQLVDNGFPRPDPEEKGKAVMKVDPSRIRKQPHEPDKRLCDRCLSVYQVDELGLQVNKDDGSKEDCIYHWGRIYRRPGQRGAGPVKQYYCCQGGPESEGCTVNKFHCTDILDYNNMRGFVATMDMNTAEDGGKVFALDCEMCNTTQGNELTRVTVVDYSGKTVYESLVKPDNVIIDYNTRFSGITEEDMDGVTTTLRDVQAVLLMKFSSKDILIGHSLESDLKVLKLLHNTVVDTSVVFPHKMGPPAKRSLKDLSAMYIKRIIQSGIGGHDSCEDALAALDLMKMKVREDVKILQQKAAKQANARK